jgi:hypothetical protein
MLDLFRQSRQFQQHNLDNMENNEYEGEETNSRYFFRALRDVYPYFQFWRYILFFVSINTTATR